MAGGTRHLRGPVSHGAWGERKTQRNDPWEQLSHDEAEVSTGGNGVRGTEVAPLLMWTPRMPC